jgi:iron(III) transport system permease protein
MPRASRLWHYGLLAAALLMLGLFLVYPILLTLAGAFYRDQATHSGFTLENIGLVFEDPRTLRSLLNSLKVACGTTTLAIVIALPLAIVGVGYRYPGKGFFNAMVLVPLILPPFVGAIGMRALLGRMGALNALFGTHIDVLGNAKIFGVMLIQALSLYPIIYLNATAALANLDPALDEAAENLGAGPFRRFFRITLPLVRPGLFAGATIVFIWSFTELGTPLMFDYYEVAPVQIFNGLKEVESSAKPYALTAVMLAAAIGIYVLGKVVFGGKGYAMYSKASRAAGEKRLVGVAGWGACGAFALVGVLALLPHAGVVLTSISQFRGSGTARWLPTAVTSSTTSSQALTAPDSFRLDHQLAQAGQQRDGAGHHAGRGDGVHHRADER